MFDFLKTVGAHGPPVSARDELVTLLCAMALGLVVAWVYRRTRPNSKEAETMQGTLVLLAILIAIVTQVVGESPARAFSLVGALSIVRFRTVVQDTQDTAFVIFAVVMGMAVGTGARWVAVIGLGVVTSAAFLMRTRQASGPGPRMGFLLKLKMALGTDVNMLLTDTFKAHLTRHRLLSMETTRQGTAIEASYAVQFRPDGSAEGLVKALNRLEGVQNVQLQEADVDDD